MGTHPERTDAKEDTMKIENINFTDSIKTALSGDMRGFEFIYHQTYRYYRAMIIKQLPNDSEVDDLLQEIYLKIFKKLKDLRAPENFFPWSKELVSNMIKNEHRHRSGKMSSNTEYRPMYSSEEEGASLEDLTDQEREYNRSTFLEEYNPELAVEKMELKKTIDEMLDRLPENQRACILLWQEGYSTNEMAEALNIPANTVLSNVRYAKQKIKANVLDMEKKGIKLYGMSPLTFFFWVLEQFDHTYADTLPIKGDMALWEQIGETMQQAPSAFSDAANLANNSRAASTNHMQNSSSTMEPVHASKPNTGTDIGINKGTDPGINYGTGSGIHSGTSQTGKMATATVIKGTATATTHSIIVKAIITIVTVVTVGTGGYFTYKHFTSNAFTDHDRIHTETVETKGNDKTKAATVAEELGYVPLEKKTYETYWRLVNDTPRLDPITLKENTYLAAGFTDLDQDDSDEFYVLSTGKIDKEKNSDSANDDISYYIYNISVFEQQGGKWVSQGTEGFRCESELCDNFERKFYVHENKFYLYDVAVAGSFYEGYLEVSICQYEDEKLSIVPLTKDYMGKPVNALTLVQSMHEEDVVRNKQILEDYDIHCPDEVFDFNLQFDDSFQFISKIYATSFVGAGNIYAYDTLEETGKEGPVKITLTDDENETYQFFNEEQLKSIRKQLRVPESDHITTTVDEYVQFWEGTGIKYVYVSFDDGNGHAYAKVDVEDAEVCGDILGYTLNDDY